MDDEEENFGSERDFGESRTERQTDKRQVGEVVRKQSCNGIFYFFWHSKDDQKNSCTDQPPPITTLHTNDRVQK